MKLSFACFTQSCARPFWPHPITPAGREADTRACGYQRECPERRRTVFAKLTELRSGPGIRGSYRNVHLRCGAFGAAALARMGQPGPLLSGPPLRATTFRTFMASASTSRVCRDIGPGRVPCRARISGDARRCPFGAASESIPKFVSPSDPAAQWTGALKGHAFFAYATNYVIDLDHAIVLDVEATRAIRQAEVGAARTMLDRVEKRFGLYPEKLAADRALWIGRDARLARS